MHAAGRHHSGAGAGACAGTGRRSGRAARQGRADEPQHVRAGRQGRFLRGEGSGSRDVRGMAVLSTVLIAAACSSARAPSKAERVRLEGQFDVGVISGSFVPESCTNGTFFESDPPPFDFACVAFPRSEQAAEGFEWQYLELLAEQGWVFSGCAANVLSAERPIDENCSVELSLIGMIQGEPSEVAKWGTQDEESMDWSKVPNGMILFVADPEPLCGAQRYAKQG